jgi:SEC-C motif-containing protein
MTTPLLDPQIGMFRLPGDEPSWIWAFTCRTQDCSCRDALVLATPGDRETLLTRGAAVGEAWSHGDGHIAAAAALSDVSVFHLDLDSAEVALLQQDTRLTPKDLAVRPQLRRVVERIDGEILDAIGHLWHLGKGTPDPEEANRDAPRIELEDWEAGDLVAWNEVLVGVRDDLYVRDDGVFEATELYCVASGCACGETVIRFSESRPREVLPIGAVRIAGSGKAVLEPDLHRQRGLLERLWAAFQRRHPRHRERFARKAATLQELGPKIVSAPHRENQAPVAPVAAVVAKAKVGRNEPCPCGSGKKYKRCCGAT